MSFKPDISAVAIANEALAMLPADPIQDMGEPSLEARECRRFYKTTVARLLERHHWGLATKRAPLAATVNARGDEWAFAYAKPTDLAYPVSMSQSGGGVFTGWFMQDMSYLLPGGVTLFRQVGKTIYSRVAAAVLEYTSFEINEGDFTTLFKDVLVLELASRICRPITKDDRLTQELASRAEYERRQAIANDLNRNPMTYGNKPTESEIVRGAGLGRGVGGYALDPVRNPANGIISSVYSGNTGY